MESGNSKRILVVDDEESLCLMVLNFLRLAGYDCRSTSDPNHALAMLEEDNFGLVITDITMPEMNGMDLLREIRVKHSEVDTIIMTGYTADYTYSDIIRAGAADFIEKPFGLPELKAKVERVQRERSMLSQIQEANAAVEVALNRMHAITDSARDAIVMMDQEGMITYWNPAAETILGYTTEEAIGRNLHRLIVPQRFRAAHHAAFPRFLETGRGRAVGKTLELVACRKEGEEIPVELSLSAVFINGWHAVGLLRDITERKQAEEALRREEILAFELSRAKQIYDQVAQCNLPQIAGIELDVLCLPAEKIGGDVVEIIRVSEKKLLIFLADVTGHGISAAMTANAVKMLFNEIAFQTTCPAEICMRLNRLLCGNILPDDTIAACCALIDLESMNLIYCLTGIPQPAIWRSNELLYLDPSGMPLGVFEDYRCFERSISIRPGDIFIACTDGITESGPSSAALFGKTGISKCLKEGLDAHCAVDSILGAATEHQSSAVFRDDVIIMAVHMLKEIDPGTRPFNRFRTDHNSVLTVMTRHVDIDRVVADMMGYAAGKGMFPADEIARLQTALFEMLTNAVEHGNLGLTHLKKNKEIYDTPGYWEIFRARLSREYGERALKIECAFDRQSLQISVEDEGEGFDVQNLADPTRKENLLDPTGRGIYLSRMLVDRVVFNSKGNKVVLSKDI
jgi:PAS domain S-box-containing protein